MSFKNGDRVILAGSGVNNAGEMIVRDINILVTVFWFDKNGTYNEAKFPEKFLVKSIGDNLLNN